MERHNGRLTAPDTSYHKLTADAGNPALLFGVVGSLFNLVHDEQDRQGSPYVPADLYNLACSVINVTSFPYTGGPKPMRMEIRTWPDLAPNLIEQAPGTLRQYITIGTAPSTLCASGRYSNMPDNTSVVLQRQINQGTEQLHLTTWTADTVQELHLQRNLHAGTTLGKNSIGYDISFHEHKLGPVERMVQLFKHRGVGLLGLSRFLYSRTYSELNNLPLLFPPM